jgi:hypothetical protein
MSGYALAAPTLKVLFIVLAVMCWDYPIILFCRLASRAVGGFCSRRNREAQALPVLVVIPSLLRGRDEVTSIESTVQYLLGNGYPGDLAIVVTIDGTEDAPQLYAELRSWANAQPSNPHQRLFVTGTPVRRSKPMAIDHAVEFVKRLVAQSILPAFPPVYISTDADADLGPCAIEKIVYRLQRRNLITGWPARIVAGALHVRGNNFWQGWRHFLTVGGQLNLQVAREYYVGNIWRYNIRWLPLSGVPGAFYCTWSEIFLALPGFLGYSRTLKRTHWYRWWLGQAPPKFSESSAAPLPELMAGDTDDTVTAYLATLARWKDGHFVFDCPRTPLHAFLYMLVGIFIDRPIWFEPEAKVFTSSPTTVKSLFRQRKRWNSSRIELAGRFWPVLGYHWTLGITALIVQVLMARTVLVGVFVYFIAPVLFMKVSFLTGLVLGYLSNILVWFIMTLLALMINNELSYWRIALALPLAPIYQFVFNWMPGAVGAIHDVLLFGNVTGFSPEATLRRGGSSRITLLFRVRRAFLLTIRSVVSGDVPLSRFWLGWRETPWTPSGFEGWTTKKRPPAIVPPVSRWFARSKVRGPAGGNDGLK